MPQKKSLSSKPILRKNKTAIDEIPPTENSNSKNEGIAPHYDTQNKVAEVNTDVEISKESIEDAFQTDSRPSSNT